MKRFGAEKTPLTFSARADAINDTPELELPDPESDPVDVPLLVEETKVAGTLGMLLCLDRRQQWAQSKLVALRIA